MKRFFFERLPVGIVARRYHGVVYHDCMRRQRVTVLVPFNFLVCFACWVDFHIARYLNRESWIDREVARQLAANIERENKKIRHFWP